MGPPNPLRWLQAIVSQAVLRCPLGKLRGVITWRNGTVSGTRREWPGAVELDVSVDGAPVRALAYPALTGLPRTGDRVLLNTTALDLGLGTGAYALVAATPDRLPPDPGPSGHLVKARYTPLQATVAGADEQGSAYHDVLRDADDIAGMPVVVADLHSALPAVLAGVFDEAERTGNGGRRPRGAYVMQDGGALPAWVFHTCAALQDAGSLSGARASRPARRPPCAAGRYRGRRAGPGQPRDRNPLGFLRGRGGRGGQRRRRTGRPGGGLPAGERGRPARAPPGYLASQPDGVRPGGAGPGGRGGPRPAWAVRRPGRGRGGRTRRPACDRHRARRRSGDGTAGQPGPAVHDGPGASGGPRVFPRGSGGWPARQPPAARGWGRLLGGGLERVDNVDDEDQRVLGGDAGLRLTGAPVGVLRRDDEHDPAAHGLARQAGVPPGDHLLRRRADDEAERGTRGPGGVEDLLGPPDVTGVLGDDELALGHLRAAALDQRLGHQGGGRVVGRDRDRRAAARVRGDGWQAAAARGFRGAGRGGRVGVRLDHVDNEHQRGAAGDAKLGVPRGPVTFRGRDHGQDPAAYLLADERRFQAGQHGAADHRRVLGKGVRLQGGSFPTPEVQDEVRRHGVRLGDRGAGAGDHRLDGEFVVRVKLRDLHHRRGAERPAHRYGRVRVRVAGGARTRAGAWLRRTAAGNDQAGQQWNYGDR